MGQFRAYSRTLEPESASRGHSLALRPHSSLALRTSDLSMAQSDSRLARAATSVGVSLARWVPSMLETSSKLPSWFRSGRSWNSTWLTLASCEEADVLSELISMPTPRGQEAQLDQVVEAHRIAREGRIDYASGKEEEDQDQDQFSSSGRPAAVRAVAGWAVLGELAAGT